MLKDWKEITNDELLNFDGPQTAQIARYERIMRQRTVDALGQVWAGLFDVKKSLHIVGDKFEARMQEAEKIQRESSASQSRVQSVTACLTVVLALATVVYTWITWQSVQAQREANTIQREALAKSAPPAPNLSLQPTGNGIPPLPSAKLKR